MHEKVSAADKHGIGSIIYTRVDPTTKDILDKIVASGEFTARAEITREALSQWLILRGNRE